MKLKNEELIKEWEQLRLTAYKPTPNDVWTIGWGHTKGVFPGMKIDKATAQEYFREDVAWAEAEVNNYVKVPLNQNQFDALVSFVFNIGAGNWRKSTMLRKLNAGDYEGAAAEFPRWNKQKGKVLNGLVRRRAHEMELFQTPTSSSSPFSNHKPDAPATLKPLALSKELAGGLTAAVSGVAAFWEGIPQKMESGIPWLVTGALVAFGIIIVINRFRARRKGSGEMDIVTLLKELGGGLNSVVILSLGWVAWHLWKRVNELYDNALRREKEHSQELLETIRTVEAAIKASQDGG